MGLLDRLKARRTKRVVLIGLDGTPFTLAKRFGEDGTMPALAELVRQGSLRQMDTSIPDISSVAWTSFMTGANPGRHGIYGFLDLQPGSYKIYFPNSKHIKADTLWDVAGRNGKRSIVVNVPSTYPARPLNGMLVAGFVAVDLVKATYPAELVPRLKALDYRIDVDARKVQQSHDALMEDILKTLERRIETLLHLYDKEEWDMFIGVITSTDRLQHFFFDAIEDENHKYHSAFKDYYRRVDGFLGAIASRLKSETLFIMSDHGFTGIEKQVYLNRWLVENGYLRLKANPKSIEDIDGGSAAFALDPGRIYVNVKGRYPNGTINPADAPKIVDELKEGLAKISDGSRPVIKQVYTRDSLFKGACIDAAPDLCVQSIWRYDLKGAVNKTALMDRELFTGMHTQDDATFYISEPESELRQERVRIFDVAPSILDCLGIAVPREMDGRSVLKQ